MPASNRSGTWSTRSSSSTPARPTTRSRSPAATARSSTSTRWTGDFAEARNEALERTDCEWILYIDADERLASVDRADVERLLGAAPEVAFRILLQAGQRIDALPGVPDLAPRPAHPLRGRDPREGRPGDPARRRAGRPFDRRRGSAAHACRLRGRPDPQAPPQPAALCGASSRSSPTTSSTSTTWRACSRDSASTPRPSRCSRAR